MLHAPDDRSSEHPPDLESRIAAGLERISQAFRILLWSEGKTLGLTPIQIQVLTFLRSHPDTGHHVSDLAREFNMTKATISDVIKVLYEKSLVRKKHDKADGRSYAIHLTKKGMDLATRTSDYSSAFLPPIQQMRPAEKEAMLQGVIGIIRHLNNLGVIPIQRMCFTCSHYKPNFKGNAHFCSLLNSKLGALEIRLDCPEHEQVVEA